MRVPLVIRSIGGGGLRFGPQHSQTGESWLLPVPGLRIVSASTPASAYGLLRAAIRDDNPVLFIEHKALLSTKGPVERSESAILELGKPEVMREGSDVTIVASLLMVSRALAAAEILAGRGINAEVIDIRSLRPYNGEVVRESLRKTAHLFTVEEQAVAGGWGSMVCADVTENAFYDLDGPPVRIGLPEFPLPYSPPLEDAAMPGAKSIADTIIARL